MQEQETETDPLQASLEGYGDEMEISKMEEHKETQEPLDEKFKKAKDFENQLQQKITTLSDSGTQDLAKVQEKLTTISEVLELSEEEISEIMASEENAWGEAYDRISQKLEEVVQLEQQLQEILQQQTQQAPIAESQPTEPEIAEPPEQQETSLPKA